MRPPLRDRLHPTDFHWALAYIAVAHTRPNRRLLTGGSEVRSATQRRLRNGQWTAQTIRSTSTPRHPLHTSHPTFNLSAPTFDSLSRQPPEILTRFIVGRRALCSKHAATINDAGRRRHARLFFGERLLPGRAQASRYE